MKYLKVKQFAGKINVSKSKAYEMVKKGYIPSVSIDGCIRIPEELVDEMLSQQIEKLSAETIQ